MIFITGDVHYFDKHNWEQEAKGSEVLAAKEFLDILKKNKLSCTLFVNGISFEKEKEGIKKLLSYDVELGGHTYDNYGGGINPYKSYIYRKVYGCYYGSIRHQEKDIRKTKEAFEKFGLKMTSWRTHAFASNDNTFKILKKEGVKYVSDYVGEIKPSQAGVIHMPINIPVDQNTIAFGKFTPENRDPFIGCTKGRIRPEEWFDILKKRVIENEKKGVPSIILIHPITMKVLDNFKLLEKVAKFLSGYESKKLSEYKLN